MTDPAFYKQSKEEIVTSQKRMEEIEALIAAAYRRWEELEAIEQ
jgi:hypothetical protein